MGYRSTFLYNDVFLSLKNVYILANSAEGGISSGSSLFETVPVYHYPERL